MTSFHSGRAVSQGLSEEQLRQGLARGSFVMKVEIGATGHAAHTGSFLVQRQSTLS